MSRQRTGFCIYKGKVIPYEPIDAVALLTHDDSISYIDYIEAIKANPIAVKVKLADLLFHPLGSEIDILESGKFCEAYIDVCICWRRAEDLSFLIGRKIKRLEVFRLPIFQRYKPAVEE